MAGKSPTVGKRGNQVPFSLAGLHQFPLVSMEDKRAEGEDGAPRLGELNHQSGDIKTSAGIGLGSLIPSVGPPYPGMECGTPYSPSTDWATEERQLRPNSPSSIFPSPPPVGHGEEAEEEMQEPEEVVGGSPAPRASLHPGATEGMAVDGEADPMVRPMDTSVVSADGPVRD